MTKTTTSAKADIYEKITARLIAEIETGAIPWVRPWFGAGDAWSRSSGKAYSGVNAMLPPGEYATFAQIRKEGGHVKKGAKSYPVVFSGVALVDDPEAENGKKEVFMQKHFAVFRVGDQTEGIEPRKTFEPFHDCEPVEIAEKIIGGYTDRPAINPTPTDQAYYREATDAITLPEMRQFVEKAEYYSTLFHELAHSTGAKKRLDRDSLRQYHDSKATRAKEELIAELTAALLCGQCGISNTATEKNTAAYLQSWLQALKNDKKYIFDALKHARQAVEYIKKN